MRKFAIVIFVAFLLGGCSKGVNSKKYLNDAGQNMVNAANGGDFAVYGKDVYYFSTDYNQLVKKEIGKDKIDTVSTLDIGLKDLNFIGDDLLYLVPYMEADFLNQSTLVTYSAPVYTIGCYNVSGKSCGIDFTRLNEYIREQEEYYMQSGLLNSDGYANYYHNISDIHVTDTSIIFTENMVFKNNVRVTVKEGVYKGGQVIFNFITGQITNIQLAGNYSPYGQSIEYVGNHVFADESKAGLLYVVKSNGESYLNFVEYDEISNGESHLLPNADYASNYGTKLVYSTDDTSNGKGIFLFDSEIEREYRKISNLTANSFQFYNGLIFINAPDGLYSYDDKEKKLEKLITLQDGYSTCSLYKFNEILYCGYPDYKVYEFDLSKWSELTELE